jgi:hypothetical protein
MSQVEYMQLMVDYSAYDSIVSLLNTHGADGWRVILENSYENRTCFLLMRDVVTEDDVADLNGIADDPPWKLTTKERNSARLSTRLGLLQHFTIADVETILRRRYEEEKRHRP